MRKRANAAIMVAIADVNRSPHSLLRKAAALARQRNVGLDLVHIIALPYGPVARGGKGVRSVLKESIDESRAALEKLARLRELQDLEVETTVAWDYPASDALIRQVLKRRPSLLIAESRRHTRLARVVLSNTDWDLIRNCPCPVLLSKTQRMPPRPYVVAAVDPFHARAKPAGLDAIILETAVLTAGSPERVIAFHAHPFPPLRGAYEAHWETVPEQELAGYERKLQKKLAAEAKRFGIPEENIRYVRGEPEVQLPQFAERSRADIVVMGAVSRSGLKRLFIGNTAERVIDSLGCDVLIVKPKRFVTPVKRRPATLVPYPPYPTMM